MKAMVLAAGLGTRLRPLTDDRPKALVTVAGRTMLEIALERLRAFGVDAAIVNAHHFAEQIVVYLAANGNFGMRIAVSREETLLDTGGGLKQAGWFFAGDDEPFLVHNVDVMSGIDLGRMVEQHRASGALATLAVQARATSRALLFDGEGRLCGRVAEAGPVSGGGTAVGFCGIHAVSPRILGMMTEAGAFSIIDCYLRLAAEGERVLAFRADGVVWRDLGTAENVAAAAREMV